MPGLNARFHRRLADLLAPVDAELAQHFPGDLLDSQPVHTVYVPADQVDPATPSAWGAAAREILAAHTDTLTTLATPDELQHLDHRLATVPIEDVRIDLEDGFGWRSDAEEDAYAQGAGDILRHWATTPGSPRMFGVRAKGLGAPERARGLRTLEIVLDRLGGIPPQFVVTLPKVRHIGQVHAMVTLAAEFETVHGGGPLLFELQIESPQAVIGADGTITVPRAIATGGPRLLGLHYGTYDYSAACGITADNQSLEHPVADFAKDVMTVAAAQTGVWVSDGSTNILPVGDGAAAALELHHRLVTRSLRRGIYQGWDMHPGHLVTRWLATTQFYRVAAAPAVARLIGYLARSSSGIADEPATAQALARTLLRGLQVGAVTDVDLAPTGLTVGRLQQLQRTGR